MTGEICFPNRSGTECKVEFASRIVREQTDSVQRLPGAPRTPSGCLHAQNHPAQSIQFFVYFNRTFPKFICLPVRHISFIVGCVYFFPAFKEMMMCRGFNPASSTTFNAVESFTLTSILSSISF
jgi:hypothetical protein